MAVLRDELIALRSTDDIIKARQLVRDCAVLQGLSLVDQTKLVTAASELARNTLVHGGGGEMCLQAVHEGADRKSTRLNSSHSQISYAVFCLKKKKTKQPNDP